MKSLLVILRLFILSAILSIGLISSVRAKPSSIDKANQQLKPQSKKQSEWIIDQSMGYGGQRRIYLSDKALRIDNLSSKNQIVCKAPDWTVNLFKTEEHLIHKQPFEKGLQWFNYDSSGAEPALESATGTATTFQKLKIVKYGDDTNGMWLTHDISTDPHCRTFYLAYYFLKPVDGIPLKYCCKNQWRSRHQVISKEWGTPFDDTRRSVVYLQTSKIEKVKFKQSDFDVPTGYKAASLQQMLADKNKNAEVESLFSEMKVGQELGKKKD